MTLSRAEIVEKIWLQEEEKVFLSRDGFFMGLDGWEITPREIDGVLAGATLTRGPEFHFVSFGMHKAVPPALMVECLQPIIDQYGFVQTRTPKEDTRQRRFNLLLGFCVESEDEYFTYYRMQRLKLRGAETCRS